MGKKTKVKRKRNVKKTRRKRIRGGVTDEERRAAKARMQFAQQLAQQRAAEAKQAEQAADEQWAAEQLAAEQQRMELARRQKAYANLLRQQYDIADTARMEQDNKAPRGWVAGDQFAASALEPLGSALKQNHDIIKRNKAGLKIIGKFENDAYLLLYKREPTGDEIKALIIQFIADMKVYINKYESFDEKEKPYYLNADIRNIDKDYFIRINDLHHSSIIDGSQLYTISLAGEKLDRLLELLELKAAADDDDDDL